MAITVTGSLTRTRNDGGLVHINALAFSTLLSSQETDTHHQRTSRSSTGATLELYSEVSLVSTPFPGVYRDVADTRILRPPATNPREPREQRVIRGSRADRWFPGSRPALRRSVPLGARRTLRPPQTFVKSTVYCFPHSSRNLRLTHLTCGGTRGYRRPASLSVAPAAHLHSCSTR